MKNVYKLEAEQGDMFCQYAKKYLSEGLNGEDDFDTILEYIIYWRIKENIIASKALRMITPEEEKEDRSILKKMEVVVQKFDSIQEQLLKCSVVEENEWIQPLSMLKKEIEQIQQSKLQFIYLEGARQTIAKAEEAIRKIGLIEELTQQQQTQSEAIKAILGSVSVLENMEQCKEQVKEVMSNYYHKSIPHSEIQRIKQQAQIIQKQQNEMEKEYSEKVVSMITKVIQEIDALEEIQNSKDSANNKIGKIWEGICTSIVQLKEENEVKESKYKNYRAKGFKARVEKESYLLYKTLYQFAVLTAPYNDLYYYDPKNKQMEEKMKKDISDTIEKLIASNRIQQNGEVLDITIDPSTQQEKYETRKEEKIVWAKDEVYPMLLYLNHLEKPQKFITWLETKYIRTNHEKETQHKVKEKTRIKQVLKQLEEYVICQWKNGEITLEEYQEFFKNIQEMAITIQKDSMVQEKERVD